MNATAVSTEPQELRFAESESKTVGYTGGLMDKIRDNAPRLVGGLKMAGDVTAALSFNPYLMGYAAFSIVGRVILMAWGTKANQKEQADKAALEHKDTSAHTGPLEKITHPRDYPVEASAGFSTVGELFETGFGLSKFMEGGTGFTATLMGLFSVWSYANILLGEEKDEKKPKEQAGEKTQEALNFASSESKPVGFIGRIQKMVKNNPVFVSSMVQLGCSIGMLAGGLLEGYGAIYIAYNTLGLLGNVVQALFVRKNEFNIEGAKADASADTTKSTSFEEKLVQRRDGSPPGVQLT